MVSPRSRANVEVERGNRVLARLPSERLHNSGLHLSREMVVDEFLSEQSDLFCLPSRFAQFLLRDPARRRPSFELPYALGAAKCRIFQCELKTRSADRKSVRRALLLKHFV